MGRGNPGLMIRRAVVHVCVPFPRSYVFVLGCLNADSLSHELQWSNQDAVCTHKDRLIVKLHMSACAWKRCVLYSIFQVQLRPVLWITLLLVTIFCPKTKAFFLGVQGNKSSIRSAALNCGWERTFQRSYPSCLLQITWRGRLIKSDLFGTHDQILTWTNEICSTHVGTGPCRHWFMIPRRLGQLPLLCIESCANKFMLWEDAQKHCKCGCAHWSSAEDWNWCFGVLTGNFKLQRETRWAKRAFLVAPHTLCYFSAGGLCDAHFSFTIRWIVDKFSSASHEKWHSRNFSDKYCN